MAKSDCLCKEKISGNQSGIQYPTFTDLESASSTFQENGYIVVRNLFSAEEVAETCSEISSIYYARSGMQTTWSLAERTRHAMKSLIADQRGRMVAGGRRQDRRSLASESFSAWRCKTISLRARPSMKRWIIVIKFVRPLIQMFLAFVTQIVPIVSRLLDSPDIKLVQSMCLLKPPGAAATSPTHPTPRITIVFILTTILCRRGREILAPGQCLLQTHSWQSYGKCICFSTDAAWII